MPVPASINALPGQSAIARILSSVNGQDAQSVDAADLGQFAAHFQHLIGKQLAVQIDAGASSAASLTPEQAGTGASPDNPLNALLPFIEALGLTQDTAKATAGIQQTTDGPTLSDPATDTAATLLAAAVTPPASSIADAPAITAVNGPTASRQGLVHGQDAPVLAQTTAAINPPTANTTEATHGTPGILGTLGSPVTPGMSAEPVTPAKELSAGREFSTLLVAATTAGKEERATGSMAEAVHQVIASSSPAPVKSNSIDPAITPQVGSVEWTEEIGNRIIWMAGRSESRAELVLTPPQMGRIEVNLSIKGDQAAASFVSANPVVREALEAALPRLREALADVGIQLGQAQVSAENAQQRAQQEKHGDNSASDRERGSIVNAAISSINSGKLSSTATLKTGRSLVDVFV